MPATTPPSKDVDDVIEALAQRLRADPAFEAASQGDPASVQLFATEEASTGPRLGAFDLVEEDGQITITAEAWNVAPHQVHVTLIDDKLSIGLGDGLGAYKREVALPSSVDEEHAVATFRNGVLDIVLPIRRRK